MGTKKYIYILPSGPNLQIHNNMYTCFSELCKDTCRTQWTILWERRSGEIVLWVLNLIPVVILFKWNWMLYELPARSGKQPVSFEKIQILHQSCCCNKEKNESGCFSGRLEAATSFTGSKYYFYHQVPFSGSWKHVSMQFQSCVKIHLAHTIPFHEKKRSGINILWVWLLFLLF